MKVSRSRKSESRGSRFDPISFACVVSPVRHARPSTALRTGSGGHPGALSHIVRDCWIPAFAGMTTLLFFQSKNLPLKAEVSPRIPSGIPRVHPWFFGCAARVPSLPYSANSRRWPVSVAHPVPILVSLPSKILTEEVLVSSSPFFPTSIVRLTSFLPT